MNSNCEENPRSCSVDCTGAIDSNVREFSRLFAPGRNSPGKLRAPGTPRPSCSEAPSRLMNCMDGASLFPFTIGVASGDFWPEISESIALCIVL